MGGLFCLAMTRLLERARRMSLNEACPQARVLSLGRWAGDVRLSAPGLMPQRTGMDDGSEQQSLQLPLLGEFNQRNAAQAALAVAGDRWQDVLPALQQAPVVPGRSNGGSRDCSVFVDYAHTPQALHAVLSALRQAFPQQQLIAVAGCGGDRDVAKRPAMGAALRLADIAFITTDNPRSEAPSQIAADMLRDCDPELIAWNGDAATVHDAACGLFMIADKQFVLHSLQSAIGSGYDQQQSSWFVAKVTKRSKCWRAGH